MLNDARQTLITICDSITTLFAIGVAIFVRFDGAPLEKRLLWFAVILPGFLIVSLAVSVYLHRSNRSFFPIEVVQFATIMSVFLLIVDYVLLLPNFFGDYLFGRVTIFTFWILSITFLSVSHF